MAQNVVVCCRFRPLDDLEKKECGTQECVEFQGDKAVMLHGSNNANGHAPPSKPFVFDCVFPPNSSQKQVFQMTALPMVDSLLKGYNTTIFAYGQTGSGKTHTMMGTLQEGSKQRGIIPRLIEELFTGIEQAEQDMEFTLRVLYVEIYNERIRDLLDPEKDNLKIRELNGDIWLEDVTEVYVGSHEEVLEIMSRGQTNRAIASTCMNEESSRSHSVFIVTLGQSKMGSKKSSKLILVDLAGSEKVRKTRAAGSTLKEAMAINKSLSALGNVINALTEERPHIPYRDSKLTRLLSDSLGGNSKTCLIVTASPSEYNLEETVSTLRFGTRAKNIKNKPRINQELSTHQYKQLLAAANEKLEKQAKHISNLETKIKLLEANGATMPAGVLLSADGETEDENSDQAAPVSNSIREMELEEKVKALQEANAELNDDVKERRKALNEQLSVLAGLREELETARTNADKAEDTAENFKHQVTELELRLEKSRLIEQEYKLTIANLNQELSEAKMQEKDQSAATGQNYHSLLNARLAAQNTALSTATREVTPTDFVAVPSLVSNLKGPVDPAAMASPSQAMARAGMASHMASQMASPNKAVAIATQLSSSKKAQKEKGEQRAVLRPVSVNLPMGVEGDAMLSQSQELSSRSPRGVDQSLQQQPSRVAAIDQNKPASRVVSNEQKNNLSNNTNNSNNTNKTTSTLARGVVVIATTSENINNNNNEKSNDSTSSSSSSSTPHTRRGSREAAATAGMLSPAGDKQAENHGKPARKEKEKENIVLQDNLAQSQRRAGGTWPETAAGLVSPGASLPPSSPPSSSPSSSSSTFSTSSSSSSSPASASSGETRKTSKGHKRGKSRRSLPSKASPAIPAPPAEDMLVTPSNHAALALTGNEELTPRERILIDANEALLRDLQKKCQQHLQLSQEYDELQSVDYSKRQTFLFQEEAKALHDHIENLHRHNKFQKELIRNRTTHITNLEHALHESNLEHRQRILKRQEEEEVLRTKLSQAQDTIQMLLKQREGAMPAHSLSPKIVVPLRGNRPRKSPAVKKAIPMSSLTNSRDNIQPKTNGSPSPLGEVQQQQKAAKDKQLEQVRKSHKRTGSFLSSFSFNKENTDDPQAPGVFSRMMSLDFS